MAQTIPMIKMIKSTLPAVTPITIGMGTWVPRNPVGDGEGGISVESAGLKEKKIVSLNDLAFFPKIKTTSHWADDMIVY